MSLLVKSEPELGIIVSVTLAGELEQLQSVRFGCGPAHFYYHDSSGIKILLGQTGARSVFLLTPIDVSGLEEAITASVHPVLVVGRDDVALSEALRKKVKVVAFESLEEVVPSVVSRL